MPATITYISVAPEMAVPVRVFINRKKLLLLNAVAVNEKSIIKLSSVNLIRLSNFDLTNLMLDVGGELKTTLLEKPLASLFPQRSVLRASKLVCELSNTWKCRLVVSLGYIADLRFKLSCLTSLADLRFLSEKNIDVQLSDPVRAELLTKEVSFKFFKEEPASEDEVSVVEDKKSNFTYKLKPQRLLNCSVVDPLDLYVLHRPRS